MCIYHCDKQKIPRYAMEVNDFFSCAMRKDDGKREFTSITRQSRLSTYFTVLIENKATKLSARVVKNK